MLKNSERFGHILHHFAEGIFKPHWATHALSASSMLTSPYSDQIRYLSDRSWTLAYSPKAGGLEIAANRALINCMEDHEPLLVFRQMTAKESIVGSSYLIAGLGMIERFEADTQIFRIQSGKLGTGQISGIAYVDFLFVDFIGSTISRPLNRKRGMNRKRVNRKRGTGQISRMLRFTAICYNPATKGLGSS